MSDQELLNLIRLVSGFYKDKSLDALVVESEQSLLPYGFSKQDNKYILSRENTPKFFIVLKGILAFNESLHAVDLSKRKDLTRRLKKNG